MNDHSAGVILWIIIFCFLIFVMALLNIAD